MAQNIVKEAFEAGWHLRQNNASLYCETSWETFCANHQINPETGEDCDHPETREEGTQPNRAGAFIVYTLCAVCGACLREEPDSIL
ncbi:MAG TPA: hypothetical protein VFT74_17325 [Isosphaeraceae bacterium]|nr:hypothetical protein [Isosphaeraceae bacterium]